MGDNRRRFSLSGFAFIITGIGAFFTGCAVKYGLLSDLFLQQHSILFVFGLMMILIDSAKKSRCDLSHRSFHRSGLAVSLSVIISSLFIIVFDSGLSKLNSFISIILPLFVMSFRFKNKNDFLSFFSVWLKIMSLCVVLMLSTQIVDCVSGFQFTKWMFSFTKIPSFGRILNAGRPVTYMGHPLFSSELFLAFYVLVHLYNLIQKKRDGFIWFLVCLLGCLLSQSRMGTVLMLTAFVLFNLEWRSIKYVIVGFLIVLVCYHMGLFDNVLDRFYLSVEMGDISTGRNASIIELLKTNKLNLFALHGQNIVYDGTVTTLGIAMEYPILSWAYSFGYVVSIMVSIAAFVYPLAVSVYRKQKVIFISLLVIILDVNTFTGISSNGSKPLLYYVFICIILNVSNCLWYKSTGEG